MPDLAHHLGNEHGFFCRWIPSISAVYSLSDMSDESKSVVDSWISDLFGEGISDDLLQCVPTSACLFECSGPSFKNLL